MDLNIWKAPFYALFDQNFYHQVAQSKLGKGFLYLLYLSGIAFVFFLLFMILVAKPQIDSSVHWIKENMPQDLVYRQGELHRERLEPYTMEHPEFGPIVTFDLTKTQITAEELAIVPVCVTAKGIFFLQNSEVKQYLFEEMENMRKTQPELPEEVVINGDLIQNVVNQILPMLAGTFLVLAIPIFYFWKVVAALFYSLIGLIINQFRSEKMNYAQILNISLFALTASTLIQLLKMIIPFLDAMPFGFLGALVVTIPYLLFAIKFSEKSAPGTI